MGRPQGKLTSSRKPRSAAAPANDPRQRAARAATREGSAAEERRAERADRVDRPDRADRADPKGTPRSTKRGPGKPAPREEKAKKPARRPPDPARVPSPLAESVTIREASPQDAAPRSAEGASVRVMELHWGDEPAPAPEDTVTRWAKRGDTLLRHLAEHGAARHEYRADLREGRFVWVDPDGRVSAEASARAICRYSPLTSELVMAWIDPVMRGAGIARIDGMAAERDDVDEEGAWQVAMAAADAVRTEFLYRVTTPQAWYFLALSHLTFTPGRASWSPSTPVGLVLRGLAETRRAVESRAEPAEVLRERLASLGRSFVHESEYAYRGTDWVARLSRAGRRLIAMSERLPRSSFTSVAAGRHAGEWLGRDATIELAGALTLLEDEWGLFA